MANSKLLKEVIADAKAVKETALANAKLALEEAFTPRLQSILSQKMRQEAEETEDDEMQNEELDSSEIGTADSMGKTPGKQPQLDADTDLSIGIKKSSANSATAVSDYTKTKDINEEEEMGDDKDQEIAELRARLAELEGEESSDDEDGMDTEGDDMEMGDDGEDYEITGDEEEDTEEEDDMDLESIIRELEAQLGEEETEEEGTMYEDWSDGAEAGTDKGEDPKVVMTNEEEETDEVIDLEEILREMEADMNPATPDEGDGGLQAEAVLTMTYNTDPDDLKYITSVLKKAGISAKVNAGTFDDEVEIEVKNSDKSKAMKALDKEGFEINENTRKQLQKNLKEAYNTIKSLRSTINEVNLLNAKLLFANKLFRAHNMTNEQKVKVIETLDRTKSVREVKLVYSTLAENLKYTPATKVAKKSITEGFASKAVKSTKPAEAAKKQVINENADFSDRFKKLAGILK